MASSPASLSRVDLGIIDSVQEVLENIRADIESLMANEMEAVVAVSEETNAARKTLGFRLQVEEGILAELNKVIDRIRERG